MDMFFDTLAELAPAVLELLRDGEADATSINSWAMTHRIHSPEVVKAAYGLRKWWDRNPNAAEGLRVRWRLPLRACGRMSKTPLHQFGGFYVDDDEKRLVERAGLLLLSSITAREWRRQSDLLYKASRSLRGPDDRKEPALRDHAKWFV